MTTLTDEAAHRATVADYYDGAWLDYRGAVDEQAEPGDALRVYGRPVPWPCRISLARSNEVLAGFVPVEDDLTILDAGCGVGSTALWIAERHDVQVVGITLSSDQVSRGERYAAERKLRGHAEFRVADFCATPFESERFDAVLAHESVCHALDKAAFVQEAYRLLKPGGRLVVRDWFRRQPKGDETDALLKEWLGSWAIRDLELRHDFVDMMVDAGLVHVGERDVTHHALPSLRRLHRLSRTTRPVAWALRAAGVRTESSSGTGTAPASSGR